MQAWFLNQNTGSGNEGDAFPMIPTAVTRPGKGLELKGDAIPDIGSTFPILGTSAPLHGTLIPKPKKVFLNRRKTSPPLYNTNCDLKNLSQAK